MPVRRLFCATALATFLGTTPLFPQQPIPTSQEIIDALLPINAQSPTGKTLRSLGMPTHTQSADRGVKVVGGSQAPYIDLRISFEYDSSILSNDALLLLARLGQALQSPDLASSSFRIVGHTDAAGMPEYNDDLSRRRAEAVVLALIAKHGVAPERLSVSYRGESELLSGIDPEDARNRRVEIQNVGSMVQP